MQVHSQNLELTASQVWNHRRPLRREDLPPPLLRCLFLLQAHRHHHEDQRNQASHLPRDDFPHSCSRDRRLRPRPRRRHMPRCRCQRLLLPLLLLCRPLRPQERYPGSSPGLWNRLPARLRKVRWREGSCYSGCQARCVSNWRDLRTNCEQKVRYWTLLLGIKLLRHRC